MAALLKGAPRFSFFQAVRLLQAVYRDAPRVGRQGPVDRERIRFRPVLDFAFASSDVAAIRETELEDGSTGVEVLTTFLSLYGTASPLPTNSARWPSSVRGRRESSSWKRTLRSCRPKCRCCCPVYGPKFTLTLADRFGRLKYSARH